MSAISNQSRAINITLIWNQHVDDIFHDSFSWKISTAHTPFRKHSWKLLRTVRIRCWHYVLCNRLNDRLLYISLCILCIWYWYVKTSSPITYHRKRKWAHKFVSHYAVAVVSYLFFAPTDYIITIKQYQLKRLWKLHYL